MTLSCVLLTQYKYFTFKYHDYCQHHNIVTPLRQACLHTYIRQISSLKKLKLANVATTTKKTQIIIKEYCLFFIFIFR